MALQYIVKLNSANYPKTSKYKITYNGTTNLASLIDGRLAQNLSPQELIIGVRVEIPDGSDSLILYHEECGTQANYSIGYEVQINNTSLIDPTDSNNRLTLEVNGLLVLEAKADETKTTKVAPNSTIRLIMHMSHKVPPAGYHKNTFIVCSSPHEMSTTKIKGSSILPEFNIKGNIIVNGENYLEPD